ncbi:lysophospholipid acyltransferase family protein [Candidatus Anaplasma sp. TIGMIC]|uniref:lysophospholipid acyltransferase family protein n=1 Tax=Candidatus Anaplasma sp. TIGMIC TaxID=3020713 RepID=UPI00232CA5C0|nr:lysophospholipid acyltransferase family protein [Candidatus Anaplasma sp. TIGMIC]
MVVFSILYCVATVPWLIVVPIGLRNAVSVAGVKVILFFCRAIDGISYEVEGRDKLPDGPYIVAAEHQSPLETMILFVEFARVCFVMKREVLFIPVFGIYQKILRMVFIEPESGTLSLRKMLRECAARAKEGRTIIIFPEGTRTLKNDRTDANYYAGVAMLYQQLKMPVVPVALNTGKFWPYSYITLKKQRGKATLRILQHIEPGLSREEFMQKFKELMIEGSRDLDVT